MKETNNCGKRLHLIMAVSSLRPLLHHFDESDDNSPTLYCTKISWLNLSYLKESTSCHEALALWQTNKKAISGYHIIQTWLHGSFRQTKFKWSYQKFFSCLADLINFSFRQTFDSGKALQGDLCWNISELPTSPHQLKLLGWTDRCMQLNMVSKSEVSSSNSG